MNRQETYKEIWDNVFMKHSLEDLAWLTRNIDDNMKSILSQIPYPSGKQPKAIDIGCGTGSLSEFMASTYNVTAIDVAKKMIDICKEQKESKVAYFECDILEYNTTDKYHIVLSHLLLHHFKENDANAFFDKIYSLIDENGYFLFTAIVSETNEQQKRESFYYPSDLTLYTSSDIERMSKKRFSLISQTYTCMQGKKQNLNIGIFLFKSVACGDK
jgi:2-polyprenyl-3-methyl-5-hydroxy-6-metoxy-1,4-benzoquinol methylase